MGRWFDTMPGVSVNVNSMRGDDDLNLKKLH